MNSWIIFILNAEEEEKSYLNNSLRLLFAFKRVKMMRYKLLRRHPLSLAHLQIASISRLKSVRIDI